MVDKQRKNFDKTTIDDKLVKITVYIPMEVYRRLKRTTASMSQVCRTGIKRYMNHKDFVKRNKSNRWYNDKQFHQKEIERSRRRYNARKE